MHYNLSESLPVATGELLLPPGKVRLHVKGVRTHARVADCLIDSLFLSSALHHHDLTAEQSQF